jgi:hypothetical protein
MQYESYRGLQVRLRYALRVTVVRGLGQSVTRDFPFWVRNAEAAPPPPGPPIKVSSACRHRQALQSRRCRCIKNLQTLRFFLYLEETPRRLETS